ncbi:tetratricopeptide repeat protein [Thermodesulfobacteriota bacterium]
MSHFCTATLCTFTPPFPYSKAHAHFALGWAYYYKGFLEEAKGHILTASDFLQKSNQLAFMAGANLLLGDTYLQKGEYEASQKFSENAISFWQQCGMGLSRIIGSKISIALAKVMNNEKDINLSEIFQWYRNIKLKRVDRRASNFIGRILLNIDDHHISEAEDWIKRAIKTNQKYGMMWNLAQDYALYADLFKRKGDPQRARDNMSKAIEIFKECGADGWVERYEKELALLS